MSHHSEHVVSPKLYLIIFSSLLGLTLVTVGVAAVDLGPMNTIVALTIAVVKALLVVLYFMHMRWSGRLLQLVFGAAVLWLILLVGGVLHDYLTRIYVRGW